jgi:uncharacterized flavoprotein (TIGR03862 family)
MKKKSVALIGGGPTNLLLAFLLGDSFDVSIYEKEKNIGRKFLVAGKGGFNLTNELSGNQLIAQYTSSDTFKKALLAFDSIKTRDWLAEIGIPTFVGSSGRIFPRQGIKPIEVLEAIRQNLYQKNVNILTHHTFIGFNESKQPIIKNNSEQFSLVADFTVFALGGASWSQTGSDGKWATVFKEIEIKSNPFQSSNCGVDINWSSDFVKHHSGKPLKNISLSCGTKTIIGEALITDYGLEGNAVYPSVPAIRDILNQHETPLLKIDFKPNNSIDQLRSKISKKATSKSYEKTFNLNKVEFALLKSFTTKEEFLNPFLFLEKIKSLALPIKNLRPIDEAISTVGGIANKELNSDFSLKKIPNLYVAGEMIHWDAPTGGFLLQGCFSTAYLVAQSISSRG